MKRILIEAFAMTMFAVCAGLAIVWAFQPAKVEAQASSVLYPLAQGQYGNVMLYETSNACIYVAMASYQGQGIAVIPKTALTGGICR